MKDSVKPEIRHDGNRWYPTEDYKQALLVGAVKDYGLTRFIETGTCDGYTLDVLRKHVSKAYSIELGDYYYDRAVIKFKEAKNVELIHGDSCSELKKLLDRLLPAPTLFYLDAHFSGGLTVRGGGVAPVGYEPLNGVGGQSPLQDELTAIFEADSEGIIIIDDFQEFWHDGLPELAYGVVAKYPKWEAEIKTGMMRIWRKA